MKQLTYLFLALLFTHPLFGQKISNNQARQDLSFLVERIKQYNPALETYNPGFDQNCEALINSINDSLHILSYFKLVSKIVSFNNEGHANIGTWEDAVHEGFLNNTYKYLPFSFKIVEGKLYAWSDFSIENGLKKGDEILAINNKSVHDILDSLYTCIPGDGNIKTYLDRKLEKGFPWMYYLYVEQPTSFHLSIKRHTTNEVLETDIQALTLEQRNKFYKERFEQSANIKNTESIDDLYTLSVEANYAILTLKSFDYKLVDKYNIKAENFYNSIFKKLNESRVTSLIIDIRDNTGGRNELADELVPFILQNVPGNFLKKTISWNGKKKTYSFPVRSKYAFSGKIYCLVNGETYSAGAMVARYLNEYANAIIIGEETGTRYEGFVAGSLEAVDLPATNIKIGIPRYHIFFPVSAKQTTSNRGLLPHKEVKNSIGDFIDGKDRGKEVALNMINSNN